MANSSTKAHTQQKTHAEQAAREMPATLPPRENRIDPAHPSNKQEEPAQLASDAPQPAELVPAGQLDTQARQLGEHLDRRQEELDHREARLNAQAASLEHDMRTARLWLAERDTEVSQRCQQLIRQQQQARQRLDRLAAVEAALESRRPADEPLQVEQQESAEAEVCNLQRELADFRQEFEHEHLARQEHLSHEHQQAMTEVKRQSQAVQRRAEQVDRSHGALKALRSELERVHRETLEIRLATEELWVQLSGAAPPATLTRSLGRIRTKLADQYRLTQAELAGQKNELESIRTQLADHHKQITTDKQQFEQWAAGRQEELDQQAQRLIAREEGLKQQEATHREQTLAWQAERLDLQRQLRHLKTQRNHETV